VVFVHGINGSSAEFAVMIDRLVQDGWSRAQLHPVDFADPRWGCNADNAAAIRDAVEAALASSGATRVDLVAHSMGTLSARHYLKNLGGVDRVSTFVTLGGLHHGDRRACLNPLPVCVWQELCPTNPFLTQLNADPAAPGDLHYVSICSRTDGTVDLDVCRFDPAENIEVDGVDHAGANGLLEHPAPYPEVRRVLEYPSP
jgi:pimeloyl-ACP methyl ester carboxylesterase